MRLTYRPLPAIWPSGPRTPERERRRSPFKARWDRTLEDLERELRMLGADDVVVVEAGYRESDIRVDGYPRANARLLDPAVVISFESCHGPLRYGCDLFTDHQSNVRAVALALEALRLVDRYGVSRRGEQYQGWKALPVMSQDRAEEVIRQHADPGVDLSTAYRQAAKKLHTDTGGDRAAWDQLQLAKEALRL